MAKKQPIYRIMKQYGKVWVVETPGLLYEIPYENGTVRVGLVWLNNHWFATHYESGLDCTPASNKYREHNWRDKELLLDTLKDLDWDLYLSRVHKYVEIVNKYKEEKQHAEMGR